MREYYREYERTRRVRPPGYVQSRAAYLQQWREANREKLRERARARYVVIADAERQRRRDYSQTPEAKAVAAAYARKWRAANKAKSRLVRHRKSDAESAGFADVLLNDPCSYCGGPGEEIDHITPISGGGKNHWTNFTSACGFCNRSKKNRPLLAWMAKTHYKE